MDLDSRPPFTRRLHAGGGLKEGRFLMRQLSHWLRSTLYVTCPTCGHRPQTDTEAKALAQSACTACGSVEQYYKHNPLAWAETLAGLDRVAPPPVDMEGETIDVVNTPERARERKRALEHRESGKRRSFIFALLVMMSALLDWLGLINFPYL